jgi:hypothetical protein
MRIECSIRYGGVAQMAMVKLDKEITSMTVGVENTSISVF